MCDQHDNRGCEVVAEMYLTISNLEMTIADLKQDFYNDLTLNHPMIGFKYTRKELIEKWEAK